MNATQSNNTKQSISASSTTMRSPPGGIVACSHLLCEILPQVCTFTSQQSQKVSSSAKSPHQESSSSLSARQHFVSAPCRATASGRSQSSSGRAPWREVDTFSTSRTCPPFSLPPPPPTPPAPHSRALSFRSRLHHHHYHHQQQRQQQQQQQRPPRLPQHQQPHPSRRNRSPHRPRAPRFPVPPAFLVPHQHRRHQTRSHAPRMGMSP